MSSIGIIVQYTISCSRDSIAVLSLFRFSFLVLCNNIDHLGTAVELYSFHFVVDLNLGSYNASVK